MQHNILILYAILLKICINGKLIIALLSVDNSKTLTFHWVFTSTIITHVYVPKKYKYVSPVSQDNSILFYILIFHGCALISFL